MGSLSPLLGAVRSGAVTRAVTFVLPSPGDACTCSPETVPQGATARMTPASQGFCVSGRTMEWGPDPRGAQKLPGGLAGCQHPQPLAACAFSPTRMDSPSQPSASGQLRGSPVSSRGLGAGPQTSG